MIWRLFILTVVATSCASADVLDLRGDAGFRSIHLFWKARNANPAPGPERAPNRFVIKYCEDQAWGKYRCKIKTIRDSETEAKEISPLRLFEATLNGLRLSTNYSVEVNEILDQDSSPRPSSGRALGGNIFIQTKGFYARAINCFANSSLVEIVTGPYFGGKISVEGSTDERCITEGNFSSAVTSYRLDIDHALCGSELRNTSVRTFILVQENLPILTHSTRRFMVVCNYVPETFTVRAGVNLPDYDESEPDLVPVGNDVSEVDPSELFDSTNTLFNSRVGKQVGRALKFSSKEGQQESQKWAHLILMIVLIVSAVIGISLAIFFFVRTSRRTNRSGFLSPQEEPSAIEINENLEAVVRDFGEPTLGAITPNSPTQPPVALTGVDFDTDFDSNNCITARLSDKANSNLLNASHEQDGISHTFRTNSTNVNGCMGINNNRFRNDGLSDTNPDGLSSYPSISSFVGFIPGNHLNSVPVSNLESIDGVFDEVLDINPSAGDEKCSSIADAKCNSPFGTDDKCNSPFGTDVKCNSPFGTDVKCNFQFGTDGKCNSPIGTDGKCNSSINTDDKFNAPFTIDGKLNCLPATHGKCNLPSVTVGKFISQSGAACKYNSTVAIDGKCHSESNADGKFNFQSNTDGKFNSPSYTDGKFNSSKAIEHPKTFNNPEPSVLPSECKKLLTNNQFSDQKINRINNQENVKESVRNVNNLEYQNVDFRNDKGIIEEI